MNSSIKIILLAIGGLLSSFFCSSQTSDFGTIGSFALTKDVGRRWSVALEQELRFNQNSTSFNRAMTTVSVDYTLIRKILKAGLDYDFINQSNKGYFELKNRASFSLAGKWDLKPFDLSFRSKMQATWRDENRGDYNYNPKYVWRNMLECTYTIFGSPLKPYVSGELFCPLNGSEGFYMNGIRGCLGAKYRLSERSSIDLRLRCDQEIQQANPQRMVYAIAGWRYRL